MAKIVFIGGGSAKFVREVIIDIFSYPELRESTITLMDINRERVELAERLIQKIIDDRKFSARVESTLNQREALENADYVIISIMVGGYDYYKSDVAIPEKYGVPQIISDTTGPGAVMRIIRTFPALQKLVDDLKEIAPRAWVLNYSNPMGMNTWALLKCGHKRTVGLCHSIQNFVEIIAEWLNIPAAEIEYSAGGINHINFYLQLKHKGRNLYPELLDAAAKIIKKHPAERIRFELLKYLGYFPAEGPWHQPEYYPWFIKDQKTLKHYGVEPYFGYNYDYTNFKNKTAEMTKQIEGKIPISYERSKEFAPQIIHSMETGCVREFYGNVRNNGLISNLPDEAIVEVPCKVGKNSFTPCAVGEIPTQLAAVMHPHIYLQKMAIQGTFHKDSNLIRLAIQSDPLTSSLLTLPQIKKMTDELLLHNKHYWDN